jgi:mediator of RNA polymerase II transcription subunit 12
LSSNSPEQRVLLVFNVANELSMPFCQAFIEQLFGSDTASTGDSTGEISAALLDAIKTSLERDQPAGLELLATLDTKLTDKVCSNSIS